MKLGILFEHFQIPYTLKIHCHTNFRHEKSTLTKINFWGFLEYIICRHENVVQVFQLSILFHFCQVSVSLIFYTVLIHDCLEQEQSLLQNL